MTFVKLFKQKTLVSSTSGNPGILIGKLVAKIPCISLLALSKYGNVTSGAARAITVPSASSRLVSCRGSTPYCSLKNWSRIRNLSGFFWQHLTQHSASGTAIPLREIANGMIPRNTSSSKMSLRHTPNEKQPSFIQLIDWQIKSETKHSDKMHNKTEWKDQESDFAAFYKKSVTTQWIMYCITTYPEYDTRHWSVPLRVDLC